MMHIIVRYFDGCPNWQVVAQRIHEVVADRDDVHVGFEAVETPEDAERLGFVGSPTILVDGVDPFSEPGRPTGLTCRIYRTPDGPAGSPTQAQIAQALN